MALTARLIDDCSELQSYRDAWDALAVAASRPACSPSWSLAWWRHAAPKRSLLRAAIAFDGDRVVGIAPAYLERRPGRPARLRLLAAPVSARVEPLAALGSEAEVGHALATTLAAACPAAGSLLLEGLDSRVPWPRLLADGWPGGEPRVVGVRRGVAPMVDLDAESFEAWLSARSSHFRMHMRRARRQLEARGGVFSVATTAADLDVALPALARLHRARWAARGGSGVLDERVEAMLATAGRDLLPTGRFRVWSITVDDQIISAHLFLAAGQEVTYWLGGHDDAWARQGPSMQAILLALEQAFELGEQRFDLGYGDQDYKRRFGARDEDLFWTALVPSGPAGMVPAAELAAGRARAVLAPRVKAGLATVGSRVRRARGND